MKRFTDIVFIVCVMCTLPAAPAYAYLDPGTASLILQSTIGAIAGAMVFGKLYLAKIKAFVFRERPIDGPSDDGNA